MIVDKIKNKTEEKAQTVTETLQFQAQSKFIKWVMKKEEVDYDTAYAICLGNTDPIEHEYTLGLKLANPVLQIALFKQVSKKARIQAAKNFSTELSDEEKDLFYGQVFNEKTASKFRGQYKAAKKNIGKADRDD